MSGDAKYFQTTKKGEIKELQDDLNSVDRNKIKDAVKKVIAAMTVGKDVSMLFSDVIKSMGTDNIELKKLVYLYIINYARSQPEKAILVVNMFQKDATNHPNPLVRALAIRTMGCIRVDRITEYLCDPLNIALKDQDPYVRKTAAICVAKLYDIQSELVEERGFLDTLRGMLSDVNPMVVANAVAALTEISEAAGQDYFKMDSSVLSKLLTALNECTEWGRVFILDALSRFEGSSAQAKDICERVSPQLQHANSAVVMAAVKCVVKFMARCKKEDSDKFMKKLAPPLVTLVSSTQPEIQYVTLRNIDLIVQKYPKILQNEIRVFFVKFNDAQYVKMEKLEILIKLTTKRNVEQVLLEFKEYAQEIDVEFVRRAVRAIGRIAIKLESAAEKCVKVLSDLVKTRVNYVVQESVIVIKDIFRRYPHRYEKIIITLCENLEALDEPEAKSSMIWIIGEYAERIVDADERLEYFADSFEEEGPMVQLQLLTATVKLFLKKPDKSKELVQKVLTLATEHSDNPDLRDRGYVYWRLLSTDPAAAKAVVLAERPVISSETFALPKDYLEELMKCLSTLASVYHRKPGEFVRGARPVSFKAYEEEDEEDSSSSSGSEESSEEEEKVDRRDRGRSKKRSAAAAATSKSPPADRPPAVPAQPEPEPVVDLLGDLLGGSMPVSQPAPVATNTGGGIDDLLGEFDPFGDNAGPPAASNDLPPMHNVLLGDMGEGLNVDVAYVRKNNVPTMICRCANQGQDTISRIDVKFNKNYLGIQPTSTLPLQGSLMPSQTQVLELPLACSVDPVQKAPLDTTVQMAVRSVRGGGRPPVHMFGDKVSPTIFFETSTLQQAEFLQQWKTIPQSEDQSAQMKEIKSRDQEQVKSLITAHQCTFMAPRQIPNRGVSLYFTTNLRNEAMLIEVSIANNGACRIVVKSGNKWLSFVTVGAMRELLV